jgi:co-chaperonin GroES (HSP10)
MEMTKEKAVEIGKSLNYFPIGDRMLVLAPKVTDTTKSGIIKSESMMKAEEAHQHQLFVIKCADTEAVKQSGIEPGMKVITRYTAQLPLEMDIEGYTICETDLYKVAGYIK